MAWSILGLECSGSSPFYSYILGFFFFFSKHSFGKFHVHVWTFFHSWVFGSMEKSVEEPNYQRGLPFL